jgi:hypothetical protein
MGDRMRFAPLPASYGLAATRPGSSPQWVGSAWATCCRSAVRSRVGFPHPHLNPSPGPDQRRVSAGRLASAASRSFRPCATCCPAAHHAPPGSGTLTPTPLPRGEGLARTACDGHSARVGSPQRAAVRSTEGSAMHRAQSVSTSLRRFLKYLPSPLCDLAHRIAAPATSAVRRHGANPYSRSPSMTVPSVVLPLCRRSQPATIDRQARRGVHLAVTTMSIPSGAWRPGGRPLASCQPVHAAP